MKILNERQIKQKIRRLAIQILENNYHEEELFLIGINNNGMRFAQMLHAALAEHTAIPLRLSRVRINPADPLADRIELEVPVQDLEGKAVLIIDDVANTGRTLFYACKPLLAILPKKVEMAVLVDRKHKLFPVKVDYLGLSLATTLMENIDVHIDASEELSVFLN